MHKLINYHQFQTLKLIGKDKFNHPMYGPMLPLKISTAQQFEFLTF